MASAELELTKRRLRLVEDAISFMRDPSQCQRSQLGEEEKAHLAAEATMAVAEINVQ